MKSLRKNILLTVSIILHSVFFNTIYITAQHSEYLGKVVELDSGKPLVGANVLFENSQKGSITDKDGIFTIERTGNFENLLISYMGYKSAFLTREQLELADTLLIQMEKEIIAFTEGVVIVGSLHSQRSNILSPVPVDQFPSVILEQSGQWELSQNLNNLAPSFFSARLTYSDATDHMDPAALRGLNPDQTLILVNGKRHHPSAVVNTLGVVGRGSVINDLNTIPLASISKIEILRDGASALYGSDAIAGAINIILKENTGKLNVTSQTGQFYEGDGTQFRIAANYGNSFLKKGFINLSAELRNRQSTNRAGIYSGLIYRTSFQDGLTHEENQLLDEQELINRGKNREDFRLRLGNSAMSDMNLYLNSEFPLKKDLVFYAFGGIGSRNSESAGDFRLPNDILRSNLSIYPDGFLPLITASIKDQFITAGFRAKLRNWDGDLSFNFGNNSIGFGVNNSVNASMINSPQSFESGGTQYGQNVLNYSMNRIIGPRKRSALTLGSEFRIEYYSIQAGDSASWLNENMLSYPGAQGFPGFQPSDEVTANRYNLAFFAGLNTRINDDLRLDVGGRFENYSDFGQDLSGKLALLYSLNKYLNFRSSVSTGFRAPSLHQSYYSYTGSYYFGGYLYEIMTARSNDPVTKAFGIAPLKEENSVTLSFGLTSRIARSTSITVDVYQVDVNDRVVLSGFFYKGFGNDIVDSLLADYTSVGASQFFTNAVDTRTKGMDVILSHESKTSVGIFGLSSAYSVAQSRIIGEIHSSKAIEQNGLKEQLFDRQSRALLEKAQPSSKLMLTVNYTSGRFSSILRSTRFGEVTYLGLNDSEDQIYSPKWITDIRASYQFSKHISAQIGANNLFNIYPDKNNVLLENMGRFPYNTAVTQFGFNGGYYYCGLSILL